MDLLMDTHSHFMVNIVFVVTVVEPRLVFCSPENHVSLRDPIGVKYLNFQSLHWLFKHK